MMVIATVSSDTEGMTATGTGKFVEKGAKLAWGNKDRDILTLNYKVDFGSGKVWRQPISL